jgi:hypothetical protein
MTDRTAFTSDEWTLLRVTPSFVSVGVAAADPTGLFASISEALAGARAVAESLNAKRDLPLFSALAADHGVPPLPDVEVLLGGGSDEVRMQNFKNAALEHVERAIDLLKQRASVDELDAYRQLLLRVADEAAKASKEGGFLGIGGARVSAKERAFIDRVRASAGLG